MVKELTKEASGGEVTSLEEPEEGVGWARGRQRGRKRAVRQAGMLQRPPPPPSHKSSSRYLSAFLLLQLMLLPRVAHTEARIEPHTRNEAP